MGYIGMSGPCFFKEFFDEIVSKRGGNPKKNLHSFPLSLIKRIGGSACDQLDKPWPRSFRSLPQLFCRMSAYDCFMYICVTFGFTWISILTSESLFISLRWPAKDGKFFDSIADRCGFLFFCMSHLFDVTWQADNIPCYLDYVTFSHWMLSF